MSKIRLFPLILLVTLLTGGLFLFDKLYLERVVDIPVQQFDTENGPTEDLSNAPPMTTYVSNRRVVWAMDFLPDGRLLFTERDGAVNIVETNGEVREIATINVLTSRESGLLGIAIDPEYASNQFIYLYYTYPGSGGSTENRVSRHTFNGSALADEKSSSILSPALPPMTVDELPLVLMDFSISPPATPKPLLFHKTKILSLAKFYE